MARPKKLKTFKITPVKNPGGSRAWRVSGTLNGERIRENYDKQADALERRGDLERALLEGEKRPRRIKTRLSEEQLADAELAVRMLGPVPLGKAVADYLRAREAAMEKGATVEQAIKFFRTHYRAELVELPVLTAKQRFIESRRALNLSEKTLETYESTLLTLARMDPERLVSQITPRDLNKLLGRYKTLESKRSVKGRLSTFFAWAVRFDHALENPCDRLDKFPADDSRIHILNVGNVGKLLKAAMQYQQGKVVAPVAIALFAGLRPSEIRALEGADFRNGRIRVRGGKLRRKTNRMVPIPANLKAWLEAYPFKGIPDGYDYAMGKFKEASGADKWVHDILRHTSISFQIERDRNDASVALNCGTSLKMINRHYREVIEEPKEVKQFWDLTPATIDQLVTGAPKLKQRTFVKWPSDKKLLEMVATMPMTRVGEALGVSDNAVRKRLRKRGLEVALS